MDQKTAQRCLSIARGCHDYNGGHHGKDAKIFHQGIQTVINCLEKFIEMNGNNTDPQLRAVEAIGGWHNE